jgi:hypothetical protein
MVRIYLLLFWVLLSVQAFATDYFVDAARPDDSGNGLSLATAKKTIQAAVNAASGGDVINVAAGTYNENVTINKSLTLLSISGAASTTVSGTTSGSELGTFMISPNTNNVTVGGPAKGFTLIGFDRGNVNIENAVLYIQGANAGISVLHNVIQANGEHGLLSEFNNTVSNITIRGNTFSGQTFVGAQPDAGNNVPRQLVVMGSGNVTTTTSNIRFTNNYVIGVAGGIAADNSERGNTLVTIDAMNVVISGNTFSGTTTRFASSLRCRGASGVSIYCNTSKYVSKDLHKL